MPPPVFIFDSHEKWMPVSVEESLAPYGYLWHPVQDTWVDKDSKPVMRLNFPRDMRQPTTLRPVGYQRLVAGGNLWWRQYWLWYLYNPKAYAGQGQHEGDWEMVQIGSTDRAGDHPVLVTASQHHSGGKREAWRVVSKARRTAFYVARDSHANYFTPVADLEDQADGKGRVLDDIEWRQFGPWASWPGRWGNSTGRGMSPQSPGAQGHRWSRPELFHGQAR